MTRETISAWGDVTLVERFTQKWREDESGCWLWTAFKDKAGYGRIRVGGRAGESCYAHRVSYQLIFGPIEGELDHLCRVRHCVNPAHLEDVSHRENAIRGNHPAAVLHRSGACKKGHLYAEHAYYSWVNGRRKVAYCSICRRERRAAKRDN